MIKPLMHALHTGASLLSPTLPVWTDRKKCANRSLACFFQPLSPCDAAFGSPSAVRALSSSKGGGRKNVPLEDLKVSVEWARGLSRARQAERGTIHQRGWFWWVATLQVSALCAFGLCSHQAL